MTIAKPTISASDENIRDIVYKHIEQFGISCDLNHIDVSKVRNFDFLFHQSEFNGSIDKWDVSKVHTMFAMFHSSAFDGNISDWNVSKVENMARMFESSIFNGNLSKWKVTNAQDMDSMFSESLFNGDITTWDVSKTTNMSGMFYKSKFNRDISQWSTKKVLSMENMFCDSDFAHDISSWVINPESILKNAFSIAQLNAIESPNIFHWSTISARQAGFEMLRHEFLEHYEKCSQIVVSFSSNTVEKADMLSALWHQQKSLAASCYLTLPPLEYI